MIPGCARSHHGPVGKKPTGKVNLEGIEVHYLPVAYDNRFGFWERSISFLRYVLGAIRLAGRLPDINVCYAISVPLTVGLAARFIKFRRKIPYIFEVGDLWPDAPIQLGLCPQLTFSNGSCISLRNQFMKGPDSWWPFPNHSTRRLKKVPGTTIHLIPNMADTDFYRPEVKNGILERKYGVEKKFVISYIGAVGFANGLEYFVECARASQRAELPVHFLLCGDGARATEHRTSG